MTTRQKIGVIGGGQLAWMMAIAAKSLGLELTVQATSPDDSAVDMADRVVYGKVDDAEATAQLAEYCQVITFENEFVDIAALQAMLDRQVDGNLLFLPNLETLKISVDKLNQRQHFHDHGIPTPQFYAVDNQSDLLAAAEQLGYPLVLKARRHGYDGKGTWVVDNEIELRSAWQSMQQLPAIAEAFIPFERELAVIAARSESGDVVIYPVVETIQIHQVCRRTIAPARISPAVRAKVETIAQQVVNTLDAIGVFGIEFFLTATGEVSVNEIAPRTHNSGHYTIEGCQTSQFEQLLHIVSGHPLGDIGMLAPVAVMVNLLGFEEASGVDADYLAKREAIANFPKTYLHWYGKKSSSVGRKLGHVTILAESHDVALDLSDRIESIWYGA
ncbi:5-(carboxyamino)imidazole ribonucleotide synthase [Pseudanabaena sp. UWO310]|uniref:5-(carboxyamino)imidazole ribonucleotide synthase n=1 Tax=Pseudanabaena sp. UWO310 TaxID=2480795 RepID=UPI001157A63C|nr:5-(carboxyamino)imidazole ribonucleotide synthase [Pseudanabaena sp. UWO310]TYQ31062.1 5-(carboxyamino)imidazole ribonucleotide synthase [Pseudanabaena sp. UWO310]